MHCHILDSVLLHNDLTEETISYIYIHARMGCTNLNLNAKQSKTNKQIKNTGILVLHLLKRGIAVILSILHTYAILQCWTLKINVNISTSNP